MCGNYGPMEGKLRTQKLLDYAFIRGRLCAVITVLWAVNRGLRNCLTMHL